MAKNKKINTYINDIIKGKYTISVETGRGSGDDTGTGTAHIHGYLTDSMRTTSGKIYKLGFSISDMDVCTGTAVVRFSNVCFYGESVKSIFSDLAKNHMLSEKKVNDLICYLVIKLPDIASQINKWVPDGAKTKED